MRLQITWRRDPNFGTRTYHKVTYVTDSCFIILPLYYSECQLTLVWSNWCFLLWRLLVDLSVLLVGKEIHRRGDESVVIDLFRLVLARGAQMNEQFLKCAC